MKYEEILTKIAPCGLDCSRCISFGEGEIKKNAGELLKHLGNFASYAERFSNFMPVFKGYPQFRELLTVFSKSACKGCRSGECKYPNCGVIKCYKQKGVDFCFQCDEFPCDKTNLDPHLHARWLQMNQRMKEIGVEAFYGESRNKLRYQ